jgi:hypothetical protein
MKPFEKEELEQLLPDITVKAHLSAICRWVKMRHTLMVENYIFDVTRDCNVVFQPPLTTQISEDVVETADFWFRYPVAGATEYICDKDGILKPVSDVPHREKTIDEHRLWLLQFRGKTARAARVAWLYPNHAYLYAAHEPK